MSIYDVVRPTDIVLPPFAGQKSSSLGASAAPRRASTLRLCCALGNPENEKPPLEPEFSRSLRRVFAVYRLDLSLAFLISLFRYTESLEGRWKATCAPTADGPHHRPPLPYRAMDIFSKCGTKKTIAAMCLKADLSDSPCRCRWRDDRSENLKGPRQ